MDVYKLIEAGSRHKGKKIWTVTDLATIYLGENKASLSKFMRRSALSGLVKPLIEKGRTRGWYFSNNPPDSYEAALFLDPGAVISGLSAMSRHGIITQISYSVVCVTRSRRGGMVYSHIKTTVGNVEFYYQPNRLMNLEPEGAYPESRLASAEKALLDHVYIYLNRHKGKSPDISEVDFKALDRDRLEKYRVYYPKAVWKTIMDTEAETASDPFRRIFMS